MKKWIIRIIMILLLAVFAFSAAMAVTVQLQYRKSAVLYSEASASFKQPAPTPAPTPEATPAPAESEASEEASEEAPEEPERLKEYAPFTVDFESLCEIGPDVIGWLYCPDTVIDYPVVQGGNDYYINHAYDGTYSASASIFVEERNRRDFADANTIVYGHHMRSGAMFAGLKKWADQAYYEEHPIMWLVTPEQDYKIVLFSGYVTSAYSDVYTIIPEEGDALAAYVRTAAASSDFIPAVTPDGTGKYVVLSTCAYVFDNARYVLHGQLVPLDSAGGLPLE